MKIAAVALWFKMRGEVSKETGRKRSVCSENQILAIFFFPTIINYNETLMKKQVTRSAFAIVSEIYICWIDMVAVISSGR